jgi:pimeloyl-ACP methyl ester carboxylesterase
MAETETLVLVPGLNCTARLFGHQVEAFSAARRVHVADNRRDASLGGMARRILDDVPGRFALAGLSMGGYVAFEVLRRAPDRVARLALLDTTARPDTDEARIVRRRLIGLAETGRFADVHPVLWPRLVHPDRRGDRDLEDVVLGMMRETGADAFVRQERAIMDRPDSRPLLPGIEVPTLVLVGAADQITPPELAREMADAIEWSSLVVVEGSGHLTSIEQPERTTEALEAWLNRPGSP